MRIVVSVRCLCVYCVCVCGVFYNSKFDVLCMYVMYVCSECSLYGLTCKVIGVPRFVVRGVLQCL